MKVLVCIREKRRGEGKWQEYWGGEVYRSVKVKRGG